MGTEKRKTDRSVKQALFETPWEFEFYQAVRLIETLYPDNVSVGEGIDPNQEALRFKSDISLKFPSSDIVEITESTDGKPVRMSVGFMGAAGAHGPLPMPYTDLILRLIRDKKDHAFKDFLDIFNHRLVSLMYRTVKTRRIAFDSRLPGKGRYARCLFSLMGLGTYGLRDRMKMKDRGLLFYAGILAQQTRSMCGLEAILSDYFRVPVKGKEFIGKWYVLEDDQITEIGISGKNQKLGVNALVGSKIWDRNGKFELHIGPLSVGQFHDFLPIGTAYSPLCDFTRFYVGQELEFDIVLTLKHEETVRFRLGKPDGPKLSWTSWLTSGKAGGVKKYDAVRLSPHKD